VDRAIEIVERALAQFGAPIYVRHEIVHNAYVVNDLRAKGAVFIEELADVPAGNTVIFSAHGVSKAIQAEAAERGLTVFDATCPLVTKVHMEVAKMRREGREIIMIGHAGHPEVEGTMGQTEAACTWWKPWKTCAPAGGRPGLLAYVSQTTLSVDDTADIIAALRALPAICRTQEGRHLLRHHQPPGSREVHGAAGGGGDRGRQPQQLQLQPPARAGREEGRAGLHGRQRRPDRSAMGTAAASASASPPAPRRRKCWCRP
jgi:hypothetical protein